MKKVFIGAIFILLIVLVGCSDSGGIFDSDSLNNPGKVITTNENSSQSLTSGGISSSNTEDFIQVNIPSGLSGDLVYFELLGTNLRLTLFNNAKQVSRESNSASFFGNPGFGLSSSSLNNEAITVNKICRGPCVIAEKIASSVTVFLKVEAKIPGTSTSYDLYSYSDAYQDNEEPGNNDCGALSNSAIIPIPIDKEFEGALEAVEDIDCYESKGNITSIALQLPSSTTINVKAEIFTLSGNPHPNASTNTLRVTAGNTIKQILTISPAQAVIVKVTTDNSRAAPAGNSKYKLSFETP